MIKSVISAPVLVGLLCAPAIADSTTTYVVELAAKSQRHTLLVADRSCGEVQIKSKDRESFLRVCAAASDSGKHVRLELDRRTRDHHDEQRQTAVVVAAAGASFDLLDGKLTVKTQ